MIYLTDTISLDENEIQFDFIRSSGPGGQNVNKVATAVQLRFDVKNTVSLPEDVLARLLEIAKNRISNEGILVIEAKRFRTQFKNKIDALERLKQLIIKATFKPKKHIKKKPSKAYHQKRLSNKKKRAETKQMRRNDNYY